MFLLVLCLSSAAALAQCPGSELLANLGSRVVHPPAPKPLPTDWAPENFTNPLHHNPDDYVYIVHAIPTGGPGFNPSFIAHPALDGGARGYISASVVSTAHPTPFGPAGFILRVPKERIYAGTPSDMMSISNPIETLRKAYGLPNPDALLKATETHAYNEVVIQMVGEKSPVEIVGFFTTPTGNNGMQVPLTQSISDMIHQAARSNNLPVVEFK